MLNDYFKSFAKSDHGRELIKIIKRDKISNATILKSYSFDLAPVEVKEIDKK